MKVGADLDLSTLRTVVAVADEGHFSEAALVLGISQQSVSKRIAKIEAQLSVRLFDRAGPRTCLTPIGERFLPHARSVLASADAAVRAVKRPLRVAVHGHLIADAELMRFYSRQHPEFEIEVIVSTTPNTPRSALVNGEVDAAFARADWPSVPLPAHIAAIPAYLEPLHLLVGKDNPLAARSYIRLADITPHVAWVPGAAVQSEWSDYYRNLSLFSAIEIDTGSKPEKYIKVVDRIAGSSTLVTFIGEGTSTPWHPDSRRIPIKNPTPAYPFALLSAKNNPHPGLQHLVDHVAEHYNSDAVGDSWIPAGDRPLFVRS